MGKNGTDWILSVYGCSITDRNLSVNPFSAIFRKKFERHSTPTESLPIHARGTCAAQSIHERAQFSGGGRGAQLRKGCGAALIRCAWRALVQAAPVRAGAGRISHGHITRQRAKPCRIRKEKRVHNPTLFFFFLNFSWYSWKNENPAAEGGRGRRNPPPGGSALHLRIYLSL